jgi:hypothetical protein
MARKRKTTSSKQKPEKRATEQRYAEIKVPKHIRDQVGKAKAMYFEKVCAYVIESPYFPPFGVKKTANAWWLDVRKVMRLFEAIRYDATVLEACVEAGISKHQYYYFEENHPDFSYVKEVLQELPNMVAKKSWIDGMKKKPELAADWLKNRQNDRFNTRQNLDAKVNDAFKGATINVVPLTAEDIKKMNNGH